MGENRQGNGNDDPVYRRIARIVDEKRRENEEALGALKSVDDAWEGLNKEVDATIGTEFDLMEAEKEAVLAAKERLDRPDTSPVEDGFVVGGKVSDDEKKAGLPGVVVRVVREKDGEVLAEARTDEMGNFAGVVPKEKLAPEGAERYSEALRIEALGKAGERPFLSMKKSFVLEAGKVEELQVAIPKGRKIADRLTAAETVRDSIEEILEVVEQRLASMKAAHTALTRFAGLTRDGLRELREEIAVQPPQIVPAVPVAGIEPPASEEGDARLASGRPVEASRPTTSTPLELVRGIGPKRGEKLRKAGIPDLEALLRTNVASLVEILGFDADVAREAREEAERILKDHETVRKRPPAKNVSGRRQAAKTRRGGKKPGPAKGGRRRSGS